MPLHVALLAARSYVAGVDATPVRGPGRIERITHAGRIAMRANDQAILLAKLQEQVNRLLTEAVEHHLRHNDPRREPVFTIRSSTGTLVALRQVIKAVQAVLGEELRLAAQTRGATGGWTALAKLLGMHRETVRQLVPADWRTADIEVEKLKRLHADHEISVHDWTTKYAKPMGPKKKNYEDERIRRTDLKAGRYHRPR